MKKNVLRGLLSLCLCAVLLSCAGQTPPPKPAPPPAQPPVAGEMTRLEAALAAKDRKLRHDLVRWTASASDRYMLISRDVLTRNVDLCGGRTTYRLGLSLLDITNIKGDSQWIRESWRLDERPLVFLLLPKGREQAAGILHGDVLLAVGGQAVASGKAARVAINQALREGGGKSIDLSFDRDGAAYEVSIAPQRMCAPLIGIDQRKGVAVVHNREGFELTLGLISFARSDDDLATIMGYELAHQILGHEEADWGILGRLILELFTRSGYGEPYTQEQVVQADRLGLYLTARAGYSIERAPGIWQRLAAVTHDPNALKQRRPYFASEERVKALEAVRDEILAKQRQGQPLEP